MSADKISLVTRRKDKGFDAPTRASERAKARVQATASGVPRPEGDETSNASVSIEDGAPTVQLDVSAGRKIDPKGIAEEYLQGADHAAITAIVSREVVNGKLGLKFQFMPEHASKMLSVKQLATMLGVSTHTVLGLRKSGKIKGYHVGHGWRFIWGEVVSALEDKGRNKGKE